MRQRPRVTYALVATLLCATVLVTAPNAVSSSAADGGPRPGLPPKPPLSGGWGHVVQGGAAEAAKARQWTRVPMQVSTLYAAIENVPLSADDPRTSHFRATNFVYLMAEKEATHAYGSTAPFRVRTLAFGAVPVTATLRLAQRRSADGLPIATTIVGTNDYYNSQDRPPDWEGSSAGIRYYDTQVDETLVLRVEALEVDDVPIALTGGCSAPGTRLRLVGKGYTEGAPGMPGNNEPPYVKGYFAPGKGGLLTGTVDVPAFTGCRTGSGEDISALLTSAVSGDANSVALHVTAPTINCTATSLPQVGEYDAAALCPALIPGQVLLPPHTP